MEMKENTKINCDKDNDQNGIQLNDKKLDNHEPGEPEKCTCECEQKICEFLNSFCTKTSLHGMQYVGEKGPLPIRLLWALVVLVAFGGAIYLICDAYSNWKGSPAMVTISPEAKSIKEVYFPAVTICPPALLTEDKAREYLNTSHPQFPERKKIVDLYCEKGGFSSAEIKFTDDVKIFNEITKNLPCEDYMINSKYPDGHRMYISVDQRHVTTNYAVVDNAYLKCCTFNALSQDLMFKNLNITKKRETRNFKVSASGNLLHPTGIGKQNAFTYTTEILHCKTDALKFLVSIHQPKDAPDVEGDALIVRSGAEISYTVKPLETESSENLKYLTLKERECQYYDDVNLRFFAHYTQWNCQLDCLANSTIEECNCLPPYLPENNGTLNSCRTGSKLTCFIQLQNKFKKNGFEDCKCEQACTDVLYIVTNQYLQAGKQNENTMKFEVFFTEPTYFAYQRSENQGVSDFLASCGGLLGLFMGFSFISMIELFYLGIFGIWESVFAKPKMKAKQMIN